MDIVDTLLKTQECKPLVAEVKKMLSFALRGMVGKKMLVANVEIGFWDSNAVTEDTDKWLEEHKAAIDVLSAPIKKAYGKDYFDYDRTPYGIAFAIIDVTQMHLFSVCPSVVYEEERVFTAEYVEQIIAELNEL